MLNPYNYTNKQINDALRIRGGSRKIDFRYDLLNRNDVKIGTLKGISGAVSYGEFRQIKRSATFTLDEHMQKNIDYLSDQIQVWFILHMPDGVGTVEWSLGIFLLESPERDTNGNVITREIGAHDKSIIIDEDRFTERYYIEKGTNYIDAVIKILTTSGISKMNIADSDLVLLSDKEFPIGTKKKEAINELFSAINYNSIRVDEMGYMRSEPYVEPAKRLITHIYQAGKDNIIHPKLSESSDIAGRANVFTRVAINIESDTEIVSTFVNDDPLSPISTVSRGRQIVNFEEIDNISNQNALDGYVRRIAIESMSTYSHLSFETALMPTHGSADTLLLHIPTTLGEAPVRFSETSWEMDLKYDGAMLHEARRVIQL